MRNIIPVVLVTFLGISLSCIKSPAPTESGPERSGNMLFRLLKSSIPSNVSAIKVILERAGSIPIEDSLEIASDGDTLSLRLETIPVGDWVLSVLALDANGIIRYAGTASVTNLLKRNDQCHRIHARG